MKLADRPCRSEIPVDARLNCGPVQNDFYLRGGHQQARGVVPLSFSTWAPAAEHLEVQHAWPMLVSTRASWPVLPTTCFSYGGTLVANEVSSVPDL